MYHTNICQHMSSLTAYTMIVPKVHTAKEENIMANRNTKKSLERFKYEVADERGVPRGDGYNGNLTAKQNGSVGGYMGKKMIEAQEKQMAGRSADMQ